MMNNNSIYIFCLLFVMLSCNPSKEDSNVKIFGHSPGDKISSDFKVLESSSSIPYFKAQYVKDQRVLVRVVDSIIYAISFRNMTETEYKRLLSEVSSENAGFQKDNKELPGGLKLEGEISHWINGTTHEELFLSKIQKEGETYYSAYLSAVDTLIKENTDEDYKMIDITN